MGTARMLGDYSSTELKKLYDNQGSPFYRKAHEELEKKVPERLVIGGMPCKHLAAFFKPDTMQFAYNVQGTNKFHFLTRHQLTALKENHV